MNISLQDKLDIFDQLNLKYNKDNIQDINQLYEILTKKLSYPSTQRAILHMEANRLGVLDLKKDKKKSKQQFLRKQSHTSHQISSPKKSNYRSKLWHSGVDDQQKKIAQAKEAKYCACCGLKRQRQTLSICTEIKEIQHIGIATRLFFLSYQHVFVLMLVMFFVYSIFAIVSNVNQCNYAQQNLKDPYKTQSYQALIRQWIFAVSLHANLVCCENANSTTYQIQCWLGVGLIIIYVFVLVFLKLRKHLLCANLQHTSKSIANLSILVQNLPIGITPQQLQSRLRSYRRRVGDKANFKQAKRPIKVVKINRAAPYYLSFDYFKDQLIDQAQEKYENSKQKLIALIKYRRKHNQFGQTIQKRQQLYQMFQDSKTQRIQAYKKVSLDHVLKFKESILTTPAFVTFESSYNKQFLLKMYAQSKKLLSRQNFFYFNLQIDGKMQKIEAKINHAPKPQQVIWTNLGQSRKALLKKKIKYNIINFIFLLICFGATFGLQLYDFQYAEQHEETSLYITILVTLIIVVMSYVIQYILIELTKRERNITVMHEQRSLQQKYVTSCLANYMIAPLIFSLVYAPQFTGIAPLAETVFILSIDNAFFFPLLGVFDPLFFYNRICKWYYNRPLNKLRLNQRQLNQHCQYLQFSIGQQFAYAITSFTFTCFYAPLQPIITVFSVLGIIWMYWTQKYIVFNRCIRPVPGNRIVNIGIHKYLALGPIAFGIGCLVWPYYITHKFVGIVPSIICIVLSVSLILFFVPFQRFLQKLMAKSSYKKFMKKQLSLKEKLYSQNKGKFRYQYDRLNYLTAKQAMKDYVYENYLKDVVDMAVQNISKHDKQKVDQIVKMDDNKQDLTASRKNLIKLSKSGEKSLEQNIQKINMNLGPEQQKYVFKQQSENSQNQNRLFQTQKIQPSSHKKLKDQLLIKETKKSKKMGILNIQYNIGKKNTKINMNTYCQFKDKHNSDGNKSSKYGSLQSLHNLRRFNSLQIDNKYSASLSPPPPLKPIKQKNQLFDHLHLQPLPQLQKSESNYSSASNQQEQHNYEYYYEYNDDQQELIHQVLQYLKQQFNIDYMPKNYNRNSGIGIQTKNNMINQQNNQVKQFNQNQQKQHIDQVQVPQVNQSNQIIKHVIIEGQGADTVKTIHIQY